MTMPVLVEDLGMHYATIESTSRKRFGLYLTEFSI